MQGAGHVKEDPTSETKREAKKVPRTLVSGLTCSGYGFMAAASDTAPKEPGHPGLPLLLSAYPECGRDIKACF